MNDTPIPQLQARYLYLYGFIDTLNYLDRRDDGTASWSSLFNGVDQYIMLAGFASLIKDEQK